MRYRFDWQLLLDEPMALAAPIAVLEGGSSEAERAAAVRELAAAAEQGDPAAVNRYAAGLMVSGHAEDAERVWRELVERHPGTLSAWLNLATCQLAAGRAEECARVLQTCRDLLAVGSPGRRRVEERLAELDAYRSGRTRQERLLTLRVAALRERVARGLAGAGDLKDLALAVTGLARVPGSGVTGRDVLEAARAAHRAAPDDPQVLEILVHGLLVGGASDAEIGEALRQLERKAPHSRALVVARQMSADPSLREKSAARARRMRAVAARAFAGDRAAEAELRVESQRFPGNHQYRVDLLFAAHNRGDDAEARRLADELAAEPSAGHLVHFHIAQFYWFLGEQELSRHHFARAWETAGDEVDRDDVREAMSVVGAGRPEDLGLE